MANLLDRLTTPHNPGALVQAINPRWGTRLPGGRRQGTIAEVVPTGVDAAAIRIVPPAGWPRHRPGQFVVLGVDVNGVRHTRSFTVTSLPGSGLVELTVQANNDGVVSRHLVREARVGDVVQLEPPAGEFTLGADLEPLLFISGGSGVTPFIAMLRAMAPRGGHDAAARPRDVVLVHHVTSSDAVLHGRELHALEAALPTLRYELILTRTPDGERVSHQHLDADKLDDLCPDWRSRSTYVCGPTGMLEFATGHWTAKGLADRLHVEAFGPPLRRSVAGKPADGDARARGAEDTEGGATFGATFERSGLSVAADGATPLLDVAEAAGLAPAHGCRMGVCHTCSTMVCSGSAVDLRDGRIIEEGRHVQLCVSAAATDLSLDL